MFEDKSVGECRKRLSLTSHSFWFFLFVWKRPVGKEWWW